VRDPVSVVRADPAMACVSRGVGVWAKADKEQNSRTVKNNGGATRQIRFILVIKLSGTWMIVGLEETLAQSGEGVGVVVVERKTAVPLRVWPSSHFV